MPRIYKRGRIWYSDLYIQGKRHRKPLGPNRHAAQVKLAELVAATDAGRYGYADADILWAIFKDRYLAYSLGSKAPATHQLDRLILARYEDYHKPYRIGELTLERLEGFKAYRRAAGIAPSTINRELNLLKAMLKKAVEWGVLRKHPAAGLQPLRDVRPRLLWYSVGEAARIIAAAKAYGGQGSDLVPWDIVACLGLYAGLRCAEICWLSWADVDLANSRLHVSAKQGWVPKGAGSRTLPMPADLRSALARTEHQNEWVLPTRPSPNTVSEMMSRIIKSAGLKGTLHTLRHTYASWLVQRGVSLFVVQRLLGHTDIKTTMIYAHLAPQTFEDAVALLPAVPSL